MARRYSKRLILATVVAALPGTMAPLVEAQEATPSAADAIYLDEPTPAPEPTIAQEGPVSEKYDDGKVRVERNIRLLSDNQIVNHGKYTEYYRNGQKFAEGSYDSGVHDGTWSYWHDNGQLSKTVTFKKGVPDGAWDVFRADGSLQAKKGYKLGKRYGTWIVYYDDGKTPKIEQSYAEGRLTGSRKTFFPSGKVRQESKFADGDLDGAMIEYDESGRKIAEAVFEKGKLNGKLVRWGADGTTSEQSYRDNKLIPNNASSDGAVANEQKPSQEELRLMNSPK